MLHYGIIRGQDVIDATVGAPVRDGIQKGPKIRYPVTILPKLRFKDAEK